MKKTIGAIVTATLSAGLLLVPTSADAHPKHDGPTKCQLRPRTESATVRWNKQFDVRRVEWWKFCWSKGNPDGVAGQWVQPRTIRVTISGLECGSPGDLTLLQWRTRGWSPVSGQHWRTKWFALNCDEGTVVMTRNLRNRPHTHFLRGLNPKWSTNYRIYRRGDGGQPARVTVRGEYHHPNDDTPDQNIINLNKFGKVIR